MRRVHLWHVWGQGGTHACMNQPCLCEKPAITPSARSLIGSQPLFTWIPCGLEATGEPPRHPQQLVERDIGDGVGRRQTQRPHRCSGNSSRREDEEPAVPGSRCHGSEKPWGCSVACWEGPADGCRGQLQVKPTRRRRWHCGEPRSREHTKQPHVAYFHGASCGKPPHRNALAPVAPFKCLWRCRTFNLMRVLYSCVDVWAAGVCKTVL